MAHSNEVTEDRLACRQFAKEGTGFMEANKACRSMPGWLSWGTITHMSKGEDGRRGITGIQKVVRRLELCGHSHPTAQHARGCGNKTRHHFLPDFWSPDPFHPIAKSQLEARGQENPSMVCEGQPPRAQTKVGEGGTYTRGGQTETVGTMYYGVEVL